MGVYLVGMASPVIPQIKVLLDLDGIAREAAERIVVASRRAIDERGEFSIALSGGKTPKRLFELLAGRTVPLAGRLGRRC